MVDVAQQVRALDCGSRGRGFESHLPPKLKRLPHLWWPLFFNGRLKLAFIRPLKIKAKLPWAAAF